uniref:Adenylate cyclase n=1 Tax=Globodera rostochiensis TaxID=31243 RepID=A0A914IBL5_GLORO
MSGGEGQVSVNILEFLSAIHIIRSLLLWFYSSSSFDGGKSKSNCFDLCGDIPLTDWRGRRLWLLNTVLCVCLTDRSLTTTNNKSMSNSQEPIQLPSPQPTSPQGHNANNNANNGTLSGKSFTVEMVMFLFMCSMMIKFPVFQSLLYEKACLNSGKFNQSVCADVRAVHKDVQLQREANHMLLASSLCLLGPSIPMALLLGALFDSWSTRRSLMIPLLGVLLGDLNYVLQTYFLHWNVYFLLISDLLFGFAGGFTSVIGLLFAYSVKMASTGFRSVRVATMEGSLGLGVMSGLLLSGQLRQSFGYTWVFGLLIFLHMLILVIIVLFIPELAPHGTEERRMSSRRRHSLLPPDERGGREEGSVDGERHQDENGTSSRSAGSTFCVRRRRSDALTLCLIALGVNLFTSAGLRDILYSFLRYRLQWTDREFGLYSGSNSALNSLSVMLLYPLLHRRAHFGDLQLALGGLLAKIVRDLLLAFASSAVLVSVALGPAVLSRFPTTGMRALASACVQQHEQGKVFALIALMDGVASLCASLFFNGFYPYTLNFFAGTMLLVAVLLLAIPLILLAKIHFTGLDKTLLQLENQNAAAIAAQ